MMTSPIDDHARLDAADAPSTQQQLQRLVEARADRGERKKSIYRALLQRRLHDEMDRIGGDKGRQSRHHRLRHLALTGAAGLLCFLLINLLWAPAALGLPIQALIALTVVVASTTLVLVVVACREWARRHLPRKEPTTRRD